MGLWVDELFGELDVGDLLDGDHQAKVFALEYKYSALLQAAGDGGLTDEGPLAG